MNSICKKLQFTAAILFGFSQVLLGIDLRAPSKVESDFATDGEAFTENTGVSLAARTAVGKGAMSLPNLGLLGFGSNDYGQLVGVVKPKKVASEVRQISAGETHSLIVKADGSLWGMGAFNADQVGGRESINKNWPVQILPGGVQSVSAGGGHSLIVKTDGSLWAMGQNNFGQLGDGTFTYRNVLVQILPDGVQSVCARGTSSLIVKTDGSLWAMGENSRGQLGDGTTINRNIPVQILSGGVQSVSTSGENTLIVKTNGSLWAVGGNTFGALREVLSSGVQSVSAGGMYSLIVKTDGSLWAIGENARALLGDGTTTDRNIPVQILPGGVQSVSASRGQSLIVKTDGSLWAAGNNFMGQLGDGTKTNRLLPIQIIPGGVESVSAGSFHSLILKTDGSLWATGRNNYGQLGDGNDDDIYVPSQILLEGVRSVAAGSGHVLTVKTDGSLWAFGSNYTGQLGTGTSGEYQTTPLQILQSGVSSASAWGGNGPFTEEGFSFIVKTDGSLWATGKELVIGKIHNPKTFVQALPSDVQSVSAGGSHCLIVKTDGSLWAMGTNSSGQLGDGTTTYRESPVQILPSGVQSVSAGFNHSLIVKTDGSLWAMGANWDGQLGDGTTTSRNIPVLIMPSGVQSVSAGGGHYYGFSLIVKTDGSLWATGSNRFGQLGDGTNTNRSIPAQIIDSGVSSVSGGEYHSLVLKTDGSVWTMGANLRGQLGDGTKTDRNTPAKILTGGAQSVTAGRSFSLIVIVLPAIDIQPSSTTVGEGDAATFSVTAHGAGTLSAQWYKDKTAISGATSLTYTIPSAAKTDIGSYSVEVISDYGSVMSSAAYLSVVTKTADPVILAPPQSITQAPGTTVTFSVDTLGASLPAGLSAGAALLTYQWYHDGVAINGATNSTYTVNSIQISDAGVYTVVVSNSTGSTTSRPAYLTVAEPLSGKIINLSVRSVAGFKNAPLIAGFVVSGGSKPFLVRAAGPALEAFHVAGFMQDPNLKIHGDLGAGDLVLGSNDNWGDGNLAATLSATFLRLGAFGFASDASKDAALLIDVDGPRTVHISASAGNSSGVVLFEAYDAGTGTAAHLVNVSARNYAGAGDQTFIAGFVIDGNVPKKTLIRAVGPGLEQFGVTGFIKDPKLEVFMSRNSVNTSYGTNDTWSDEPGALAAFDVSGAFHLPAGSKDAAIVVTLAPGPYTAVVTGPSGDTGDALVEVYEVP